MTDMKFSNYREFYPFYLSQHVDPTSRRLHYLGTAIVIAIALFVISTGNLLYIIAMPVAGYFFAWVGHFVFEKNKPATFTYPIWSLMGDFNMFWDFLTFSLEKKLNAIGYDVDGRKLETPNK